MRRPRKRVKTKHDERCAAAKCPHCMDLESKKRNEVSIGGLIIQIAELRRREEEWVLRGIIQ